MTNDEIRIKIATACGWSRRADLDYECWDLNTRKDVKRIIYAKDGVSCCEEDLPNYPEDLNACHEFEKVLTPEQRDAYAHRIFELGEADENHGPDEDGNDMMIPSQFTIIHAAAPQRCAAFIRTLNL